jgi:hypothetical protein
MENNFKVSFLWFLCLIGIIGLAIYSRDVKAADSIDEGIQSSVIVPVADNNISTVEQLQIQIEYLESKNVYTGTREEYETEVRDLETLINELLQYPGNHDQERRWADYNISRLNEAWNNRIELDKLRNELEQISS